VEAKESYAVTDERTDERAEELLQSLKRRLEQAEVSPVLCFTCAILDNSLQSTTSELMTRLKKVENDLEESYVMVHYTIDKFKAWLTVSMQGRQSKFGSSVSDS
jgi:hypothetical protein